MLATTIDRRIYQNPRQWNMTNDLIFKAVFGRDTPRCKAMLIDLCNTVIKPKEEERIIDIVYLNPFNLQDYVGDKMSVLDIKAKTSTGIYLNVEMQVSKQSYYMERALYYWSELYAGQIEDGDSFDQLKKTIAIHFLDHTLFDGDVEAHTVHKIYDGVNKMAIDLMEIHFVQMPKVYDIIESGDKDLADWVTLIREVNNQEMSSAVEAIVQTKEVLHMALEEYTKVTSENQMRERIKARNKFIRDYNTDIKMAKKEGETNALIMVVKNMRSNGDTIEKIAKMTNLSAEEVMAIVE